MSMMIRILLGLSIVLVDTVLIFVPLGALFLAYILIFNPPWFREFLTGLDNKPRS